MQRRQVDQYIVSRSSPSSPSSTPNCSLLPSVWCNRRRIVTTSSTCSNVNLPIQNTSFTFYKRDSSSQNHHHQRLRTKSTTSSSPVRSPSHRSPIASRGLQSESSARIDHLSKSPSVRFESTEEGRTDTSTDSSPSPRARTSRTRAPGRPNAEAAPSPSVPSPRPLEPLTRASKASSSTVQKSPTRPQQQARSHHHKIAATIQHHRPPPRPPIIQPPLNLVAALLGEPGARTNGNGTSPRSAKSGVSPSSITDLNIRDIVSKCEDASMSWSLQFWVTIADPQTHHVFFACPASGQCSWEPPVGAFVVPRSPDGEWWELADPSRDNQSYYYNTLTGVTQWERPGPDAFVIPLGLIQRNALPAQHGHHTTTGNSATSSAVRFNHLPTSNHSLHDSTNSATALPVTGSSTGALAPTRDMSAQALDAPPTTGMQEILESPNPSTTSDFERERTSSWWERRRTRSKPRNGSPSKKGGVRSAEISPVVGHHEAGSMFSSPPTSPIPVEDESTVMQENLNPSAVSLVFQPASPTSANYEVNNFSTEDFADRYFATKRSGVLRQRLSLERIMEWQRGPITSPLLVLTKASVNDSLITFKVIQHVMGERDRPVDGARQGVGIPTATSVLSLRGRDDSNGKDEKTIVLEEIRWMIQLGVGRVEMRDELYCQLIKQLTRNPDKDATVLGFQLMCVFVAAFGPSKSFEPFVRSFLVANVERTDFGIGVMSKFCLSRLDAWGQKGGRGRVLTISEIEHASDAAFYPSVYGQTLETIMQRQEGAYPELRIPIILPFLADGILALGGTEAEGIFRVPGDNDVISHFKTRIDRGQYQLSGVDDPHVVASLFKLWLRELEEPLVPSSLYNAALQASKSVDHTILFIKKLPDHNRRVLLFVISFIQLFLDPPVVAVTKMTPQNLALILAPNVLRTSSDSLVTVFANSSFESQFVLNLLLHLDPPTIDPEYVPSHGSRMEAAGYERPSFESNENASSNE